MKISSSSSDFKSTKEFQFLINDMEMIDTVLDIISNNATDFSHYTIIDKTPHYLYATSIVSANNTLQSIRFCASKGYMGDAFMLARKLRDTLFQYLFMLETLENKPSVEDDSIETKDLLCSDPEAFITYVEKMWNIMLNSSKSDQALAVDAWLTNELSDEEHKKVRKEFFDASKYYKLLMQNESVKDCFEKYLNTYIDDQDRILNNYTHINGITFHQANLPQYVWDKRKELYKELQIVLIGIITSFLACIVLIAPSIITSSDYVEALEMQAQPKEDSQYWIASGIQEYMDTYFPKVAPDFKKFLRDNNKYGMKIKI